MKNDMTRVCELMDQVIKISAIAYYRGARDMADKAGISVTDRELAAHCDAFFPQKALLRAANNAIKSFEMAIKEGVDNE